MKWVFWMPAALIAYTYLGYPLWLWIRSRWCRKRVRCGPYIPFLSIIMVVHNEEKVLLRKLRNLLELNYPAELLEIVVVSDGSTDTTNQILSEHMADPHMRVIFNPQQQGKAAGLNAAMSSVRGEIVVFTDARQQIEPDAIRVLVENFADPEIGCASGELMLGDPETGEAEQGMGVYWRIEKAVRELESAAGSVVGATGAIYAIRRKLLVRVPAETILDDVYIPMHVVRRGARVIFDPRARAWDSPDQGTAREFSRKVRTLSGNYQLLQLAPWLLSSANPLRFQFVSHKLLRLVVPFALLATLLASLVTPGVFYHGAAILQLAFYTLSLLGLVHVLRRGAFGRVTDAARTFVLLNTAAVVAFANFAVGRKAAWGRSTTIEQIEG
ncbi:MAG: family 2 glycosyl transferase [Acidobacteria bacterium]|nr:MAG: family 2 glycosyl transferase [Acidobacteriota bacterium]